MNIKTAALTAVLSIYLLSACSHNPPVLSSEAKQQLSAKQQLTMDNPDLVYSGEVFPLTEATDKAVYFYQRVSRNQGKTIESSHTTYTLNGDPVLVQTVIHDSEYRFLRFESIDELSGISGSVERTGDNSLTFVVNNGSKSTLVTEKNKLPIVAGPTLFGFILHNWKSLTEGKDLRFAFVLLDRAQTMNFTVRYAGVQKEHDIFVVEAQSALMRLFVDPMRVVFDNKRRPIRYLGRVPPLLKIGGKMKPFDARVEYTYAADTYR